MWEDSDSDCDNLILSVTEAWIWTGEMVYMSGDLGSDFGFLIMGRAVSLSFGGF